MLTALDPRALRPHYQQFLAVPAGAPRRVLLTGHSHQAWPDVARAGQDAAFADVSHDGRVDVIAINDDADYVAVSNGSAFVPYAGPWTVGPFYSIAP